MTDAAAALLRDPAGRLLMVRPGYRDDGLLLPGSVVEPGETPADAAAREVREETGLVVTIGRLLVVERIAPAGVRGGSRYVFDGGLVPGGAALVPQPEEVAELLWLHPEDAVARHVATGRRRLAAALAAAGGRPGTALLLPAS